MNPDIKIRHGAQTRMLTLTQVIERHWRALVHETSVSEYAFAAAVREHYEEHFPGHARDIEWSVHADLVTRMRRDAERIHRWFNSDVRARFPAEALESFIAAFPEYPRRRALQAELAGRQGLLAVSRPQATGAGEDAASVGRVAREVGEAIMELGRLMEDGRIDRDDAPLAARAILEIDEALAALAEVRARVQRQALGVAGDVEAPS